MDSGYATDVDFAKWEIQMTDKPWLRARIPSNYEITRTDEETE